ncbi:MAG: sigma-70 family RNA polymerase sigma factor, partial [Planctomycetes bacterium]|nr:sigma-70 family RNA polymerase sigma factor [Planctomycetota bacterium]
MSSETPETLFRRFLDSGCEAALDTLIRRCSPRLRGFARRFGVADDRVEDLVQETMITAVQRAASWHDDRPLLPWLQGILTRKIASWARDEARRRHHHASWAEARRPDSTDPADDVEGDELRALLCAAIAAVPERYRRALELHLLHGLAPHEVAARLGRMRATVRVHLHRGLQRVRRHLPRGVHPLLLALALAPTVRPRAAAVRP